MRQSEWREISLGGFAGFIHRVLMFITWPFRHVKLLLALLGVILIIPLLCGVAFSDISDWYIKKLYLTKIISIKDDATSSVSNKISGIAEKVKEILPQKVGEEKKDKEIRFVSWNVAEFNKVKYKPIKKNEKKINLSNSFSTHYEGTISDYYIKRTDVALEYLSESEILYNVAEVSGPNSLYIDNTFMYLYGIYTNNKSYDVSMVQKYLEDLIVGKKVYCEIVAYTIQTQVATALCFVDGVLINKLLVDENLADNVALK